MFVKFAYKFHSGDLRPDSRSNKKLIVFRIFLLRFYLFEFIIFCNLYDKKLYAKSLL